MFDIFIHLLVMADLFPLGLSIATFIVHFILYGFICITGSQFVATDGAQDHSRLHVGELFAEPPCVPVGHVSCVEHILAW